MKGGIFYGLRAKQLSLFFIAVVCSTILIWAWEKTPILTSLLPPQNHVWQMNPDEVPPFKPIFERPVTSELEPSATFNEDLDIKPVSSEWTNSSELVIVAPIPDFSSDSSARDDSNLANYVTKDEGAKTSNVIRENTDINQASRKENTSKGDIELVAHPVTSPKTDSLENRFENFTTPLQNEECNYGKGKWVMDENRPLYSGSACKQWLSGMWACRLTQRIDFAYEKLRWQPKDCQIDGFTGSKFLARMRHKTLAFIGDSLGRQQFQSLMCMITGGELRTDVSDVGKEYGLAKPRGAVRPDGWAYRFSATNTTILYYWSASLCDIQPIDPTSPATTSFAMHLDRPPEFLRRNLPRFHILVLNTGHHWNRGKLNANRWIMYVNGLPNTNRRIADIGGAKNFTIHSVVNWVNTQLPKYPDLKAFYRSISPRHFFNGDWNTGGTCDNTTPLLDGKEVLKDESIDPIAAGAVRGKKVKILDITALSELRDEGHISRYSIKATPGMQDCLHWCLPGVPDTWNEILYAQI
jgi:hypothetical protein